MSNHANNLVSCFANHSSKKSQGQSFDSSDAAQWHAGAYHFETIAVTTASKTVGHCRNLGHYENLR
jgi:hypothetical protein